MRYLHNLAMALPLAAAMLFAQDPSSRARLIEHRNQDVLHRNEIVLELAGFLLRPRQHPVEPLSYIGLTGVGTGAGYSRNFA